MSKPTKSDILKKQVILALEKSLANVSLACKKTGIARSTFYDWYNSDKEFKKGVDDMKELTLDFTESKLMECVSDKNITAIIFHLKTQGKKRGYVEKSYHDFTSGDEPLNIPPIEWIKHNEDKG